MDLKISLKSQIYVLRELILITIVYFIIIFFIYQASEIDLFIILFLATFAFYIVAFFLPVTLLHINYLNSPYKSIKIEQNKLTIKNVLFTEQDINKITIYAPLQHFNDSVGVSALPYNDYYYFVEIIVKDGEKINLTSLIDFKIDKIIKTNFKTIEIIEQPSTFFMLLLK